MLRFRKISQFVIYLLCKLENSISIPRIQKGKSGMVAHNCSPSTGEAENGGHWGLLTRQLCLLVNSSATGTVSKKMWKAPEVDSGLHTYHTYTPNYTHTELHTCYMHTDIHITSTHKMCWPHKDILRRGLMSKMSAKVSSVPLYQVSTGPQ